MDFIKINAFPRFPKSAGKSTIWRLGLLVLLIALIVYFILIENSYVTAFTFLLMGGVYYIYETSMGNKKDGKIECIFTKNNFSIDRNIYEYTDIIGAEISPATTEIVTLSIKKRKSLDIMIYIEPEDSFLISRILEERANTEIKYKERNNMLQSLTHILRL